MKTRPESVLSEKYAGYYPVLAPLVMGQGVGDGKTTACLVAQAATIDALRQGKTLDRATDELHCACPLLRRMAINANDASWWKDDAERTEVLRPLIPLLLDSRGSLELTKRRAARMTNAVIHELTPLRLEWIAVNAKNAELAQKCRDGIKAIAGIDVVTDKASARKAREALLGLKNDAYAYAYAYAYASAYAYAYADAYASAYAYADADADAYADAYAYAYADADAYADAYAYADAQKLKYRTAYLELFRELAAMQELSSVKS